MEQTKRQSGIEIARIIAMLMILYSHYSIHGGFNLYMPPSTWSGVIGVNHILLSSIKYGGFGVAVFVIISGYCGIHTIFKARKVIKLVAQVFFYSAFIYFICVITGILKFNILDCIKNLFPILFQQYWFATAYIILYLISPYLNILIKTLERKDLEKFLGIMLILWCVIPTFTTQAMYGREIPKFIMFYVLGAYLRLYPDNIIGSPKAAKLGLILSLLLLFLSSLSLQLLGEVSAFFSSHYAMFYDTESLLIVLGSSSLVQVCAKLDIGVNQKINQVSSATFGVFLIHAHIGWRYRIWKDFLRAETMKESPYLFLHMLISVCGVYIICTFTDLLRQKYIEKPFMAKIDRFLDKKKIK